MIVLGLVVFVAGLAWGLYAGMVNPAVPLAPAAVMLVLGFFICIICSGGVTA